MKVYAQLNLATWPKLVRFRELNISEFWLFKINYISYYWEISKNIIVSELNFSESAINTIAKFNSNYSVLPVGYYYQVLWSLTSMYMLNTDFKYEAISLFHGKLFLLYGAGRKGFEIKKIPETELVQWGYFCMQVGILYKLSETLYDIISYVTLEPKQFR